MKIVKKQRKLFIWEDIDLYTNHNQYLFRKHLVNTHKKNETISNSTKKVSKPPITEILSKVYQTILSNYSKSIVGLVLLVLLFSSLSQVIVAQNEGVGTTSAGNAPGSPVGSYQLTGIDNINYYNGGLNFTLPITAIGGRGEERSASIFRINRIWSVHTSYNGPVGGYQHSPNPNTYTNAPKYGPGYVEEQMGGESYIPCELEGPPTGGFARTRNNIVFTDANGNRYELRDTIYDGKPIQTPGGNICYPNVQGTSRGKIFVSKDGSGITYVSDSDIKENSIMTIVNTISGYILMPNGTKYRIEHGMVKWIKDRNGNQTSFTYVDESPGNNSRILATITDSLNRVTTFQYGVNEGSPYGICDKITFKGTNGQDRVIRISYRSLGEALRDDIDPQVNPVDFGEYQSIDMNIWLSITSVATAFWLPDARSYQFKYNQYGELARVELPTGGAYEYDHAAGTADESRNGFSDFTSFGSIYRRVTQKRVYKENGILENKILIDRRSNNNNFTVTTSDASNVAITKSKHYYYGDAEESLMWSYASPMEYNQWKEGKEYKTEILDPNTQAVLRKKETSWAQQANVSWWTGNQDQAPENNPRITETKNTLETGQVNSQSFSYDQYNNLTDTYEYDFGSGSPGAFLRRSHTDYVTNSNYTDHTNAHIRNLPSQAWVSSDSAGTNKVSLSQIEYDNYANDTNHASLVNRSSVTGHDSTNFGTGRQYRGNPTAVTSYGNAASQLDAITAYSQYDILGNVVKTIDAKGNISTISYNDNFGVPNGEAQTNTAPTQLSGNSTFAFATSVTNPNSWTTYAQFDYFTGAPVDAEDLNGVVSSTFYNDDLDRPTQTIVANNLSPFKQQTTIVYDDTNRKITSTSDLEILNDNALKSESFYDGLGRTTESRRYETATDYVSVVTEYDSLGRVKRTTNPYRPLQSEPQLWTTPTYDSLGRVITVTTPDNAQVQTEYSGNTVTVTDQAGKLRRSVTNALGQLIRVDEPNDAGQLGTVASPNQATSYAYDTLSNLTTVTQGGQPRTFSYNSLSRLTQAANPESGTISYSYDNNGNLTSKTDARSVVTSYTYDNLNRVTQRSYSDSTPTVTYTYDDSGITYAKGRLTKVSSSVSETKYTSFDNLGRLLTSQQITDGNTYNFAYSYNLSGALVEETYPSGRKVKNSFQVDGALGKVETMPSGGSYATRADNFTYTAAGMISSMQLGNAKWENAVFNSRLQPTQLGLGTSSSDQSLWKVNYDYGTTDNNGNVKSQTITVPTITAIVQNYTYDSLNRIKSAEETVSSSTIWKQTFDYDRFGNRRFDTTGSNTTTIPGGCSTAQCNPTIDTANNRFTTGQGYTYDSSGNLLTDAEGRTFTYDAENKQQTVSNSGGTIGTYYYDGDGKRVKKVSSTETTLFVYDASAKLVAEYLLTEDTSSAPTTSYLTNDTLGSPRVVTDSSGNIESRRDFMPFGEEISAIGGRTSGLSYQSDEIRQKFTGYERDNETDLDFAQARMYGHSLGRFTSPDPLSASANPIRPQSWNRYSYSYNNPLRYTDPSGMIAGDFYNLDGKKIGTDGVDDKKIHIVYDEKKAKEIEKTKGNYTGTVDAKITLPGVNIVTAVNEAVNRSDAATFDKSGLAPLGKNQKATGGFREAGLTWDKDGKITVEPDGPYADPRIEGASMIISSDSEGSAHVHPSGEITTTERVIVDDEAGNPRGATKTTVDFIENTPSPADYQNAARGVNIMIGGSGNNRSATFYNKNGILATMSYKNFKKLGAK